MKELTIEEKAKAYDEAIKRAKAMIPVAANHEEIYNSVITIFLEFAESEDERIRKDIIKMISNTCKGEWFIGSSKEECLSWLEKQGQTFTKKDVDDAYLKGVCDTKHELEKQGEQKQELLTKEKALKNSPFVERKPVEVKVVIPKFRVGDEIKTAKEESLTITKIDEKGYWSEDLFICDFDEEIIWDLVEQKPTNLAKGEDHGIDGLYNAIRILEKTLGKVEGYQTDDGILEHECAISAVKKLYEQNPAWSEEDELHIRELESLVKQAWATAEHKNDKDTIHKMSDLSFFLKTLKPQLKQEWSEEDKKHIHSIISTIECCRKENEQSKVIVDCYTSDLEWFKSFMNRCKPSEDLPHWKKGTLKGKNVTGFNSDFFSHNGYYINYNELFDKLPKDE